MNPPKLSPSLSDSSTPSLSSSSSLELRVLFKTILLFSSLFLDFDFLSLVRYLLLAFSFVSSSESVLTRELCCVFSVQIGALSS
ncbi:hypothetical protein Hanom_Chr09g00805521 [Helianthus anomalus]